MRGSHKLPARLAAVVALALASATGAVLGTTAAGAAPTAGRSASTTTTAASSTAPTTPSSATTSTTPSSTTTTITDPSAAQVRAALRTATRSRTLWATINSCESGAERSIGIRGQMPSLSFATRLVMIASVDEFSASLHRYVPVPGSWRLGGRIFGAGATVQEGISLRFGTSVTLIGHITFEWFRDRRLLGATTRSTTAGHHDDAGRPPGYSVSACSIT